eukprot:gene889-970_t
MKGMTGKRKLSSEEVSAQEKELEGLLFGKDTVTTKSQWEDIEEAVQFSIDTAPTAVKDNDAIQQPVWHDEDDEQIVVNLDKTSRLKRLKFSKQASGSNVVTGRELTNLLQERFQTQKFDWATTSIEEAPRNELLDDEDYELLQQNHGLVGRKKGEVTLPLPSEKLRVQRVLDGNTAEPAGDAVTAMSFHDSSQSIAVGSEDRFLRVYRVDHASNPVLLSLKFKEMTPRSVVNLSSRDEIIVSGRKPHFYTVHSATGQVSQLLGPGKSVDRDLNSLQHLSVSPGGELMSVVGSSGYIHIGDASSKLWIDRVKMNGQASTACFLTDHVLATSNAEAEVYLWDLRYGKEAMHNFKCASRFNHDDGSATTAMAAYHPNHTGHLKNRFSLDSAYLAVGTSSGVVSLFQSVDHTPPPAAGNYYPMMNPAEDMGAGLLQAKTIFNITTRISSLAFHPSGQILAMSSYQKKDQVKLLHLPTFTVFTNWPMEQTPLHTVQSLSFSPDGDTLAVGNRRGKVLFFQMPHFMESKERKELKNKKRMN